MQQPAGQVREVRNAVVELGRPPFRRARARWEATPSSGSSGVMFQPRRLRTRSPSTAGDERPEPVPLHLERPACPRLGPGRSVGASGLAAFGGTLADSQTLRGSAEDPYVFD